MKTYPNWLLKYMSKPKFTPPTLADTQSRMVAFNAKYPELARYPEILRLATQLSVR